MLTVPNPITMKEKPLESAAREHAMFKTCLHLDACAYATIIEACETTLGRVDRIAFFANWSDQDYWTDYHNLVAKARSELTESIKATKPEETELRRKLVRSRDQLLVLSKFVSLEQFRIWYSERKHQKDLVTTAIAGTLEENQKTLEYQSSRVRLCQRLRDSYRHTPYTVPSQLLDTPLLSETTSEDGSVETPVAEPLPIHEPDFGDVTAKAQHYRNTNADHMTLYWGALDLRPHGLEVVRDDNDRADELLQSHVLGKVTDHYEAILYNANGMLSSHVIDFLSVMRSLALDLDSLAATNELYGCFGLLSRLETRLHEMMDTSVKEDYADSDARDVAEQNKQDAEELLARLRAISAEDMHVRWICRKLSSWLDKRTSEPSLDSTERTVDAFEVIPFAKLPSGISLRYGDGSSAADKSDKLLRQSTSKVGKKVDFLLKRAGIELGVGENSGGGQGMKDATEEHISDNFVSNIKTSVAQIRHAVRHATQRLRDADLQLTDSMKKLISDIAVPSFQVWNGQIRFTILFNLAENLYAFVDFDEVQLPSSAADTQDFLSICESFLVMDALINASHQKVLELENLVASEIRRQQRMTAAARLGSGGRTRGRGVLLAPVPRKSWSRVATLPLPSGTPKKAKK
ncbi:hypothetical protein BC832DRAFT_568737 [Gaertneriomyces semiglobifer]|nr:hypothetical protein BC832DRAFT_568737 [Gaertneriomyces semiglobifer]